MKAWFLFFLGTLAYFLVRYINRKEKRPDFTLSFWIKDNWQELILAFIFDLAAMLIILDPNTAIDLTKLFSSLPADIVVSSTLVLSFVIGYGGGWGVYAMIKKKVSDSQ